MTGTTRDFAGRNAFITGGVNGIGFGIARAFAMAGMDLILTYRKQQDRVDAARWLAENGLPPARFVQLDVTDRAAFAQAAAEAGKVHVLVNNAGVSVFGPTDEASYDDFDWIMGVNYGGVVNGIVSFLPGMKAHGEGGHVVNVASMAAYLSGPQAGIYTASKFAVRGLTECLRYNLAPYGIGVSLMCPGLTRTNAWASALKRPDTFAASGFAPAEAGELEQFGAAFELGMDPLEVGQKTLAGMIANQGLILTHGEFAQDFEEIYQTSLAALPDEEIPEGRLHIEALRRAGNKAAAEGRAIGLADLT